MKHICHLVLAVFILLAMAASTTHADIQPRLGVGSADVCADPGAGGGTQPACDGGQCKSPAGNVLSCPTSGGPVCSSSSRCSCECKKVGAGWSASNQCTATTVLIQLEYDGH